MKSNTVKFSTALETSIGLLKYAIIKREGNQFVLYSHKGKVLGKHPSKGKAVRQEQAIKANGG